MESKGEFLYLSRADIEKLNIPMKEIIRIVEEAFHEKAAGRTEMPPKPGIHPQKDTFIHAMPAYLQTMKAAGVKWVAGFPDNPRRGLPYISGLLVLNDSETGFPISVIDCTWITAKRTGAATAVAAKHLARDDSRVLGVLGCGAQGRSNLEALMVVCKNLEHVKAYDTNGKNLHEYVKEMTALHGISTTSVESPKKAVESCDIVVTSGPILKNRNPSSKNRGSETGVLPVHWILIPTGNQKPCILCTSSALTTEINWRTIKLKATSPICQTCTQT
jgi:ornithine cyclodeaminase/alanine dehydrogenase